MTAPIPQITEGEMRAMSAEQIVEAFLTGRMKALVTGQDPSAPPPGAPDQVSEADLKRMEPRVIVEAFQAGRLNALLGRPVTAPGQD
ncbi:hypothetical protein JNW88_18855 [Micromonospora sp. ATA32]|nr:hypothetical protein [Micromonospora sp. ATA32]